MRKGLNGQISVIQILDFYREDFRLSRAYEHKIDVIKVIAAPETEMLIINDEEVYNRFERSGKMPNEYCKTDFRIHDAKSYDFVKDYLSNPQILVNAIKKLQDGKTPKRRV